MIGMMRRSPAIRKAGVLALQIGVLVAAFGVWQLAASSADSLWWPPPKDILQEVWNGWIRDWSTTWSENVRPSVTRLLAGYLLAAVGSIALGVAIGRSRALSEYVEPVVHFIRSIPPPALLPLFLVLLGIDDSMKIALIAVGVFPPILLNTIDGVRSIDPLYLDTARVLRITPRRRFTHVILPAAAPKVFAGLRISLAIAVILMVVSELYATTNGIGFRMLQSQRSFKFVDSWAAIIVLGALGALLNAVLSLIERRVLRWSRVSAT